MNTKDGFTIPAFKTLLAIISFAIMLPMVDNISDISFYVTVSVYVLGKFIELVEKVTGRNLKTLFIIYIVGVIIGIIALTMCFYAFACTGMAGKFAYTIEYNIVLLVVVFMFCFIDVAEFWVCICKLYDTKNKLKQLLLKVE